MKARSDRPSRPVERGSERYQLENGLTVLLRPVEGCKTTALVVLYSIGNDHDPEGRSGLAHMIEHLYVTAAAGATKNRSAEAFAARYGGQANAQTGDRYTVLAGVFPENQLDAELKDAAARMSDLHVTAADIERERQRLLEEIDNMFANIPQLAATNHVRELVRPTPHAGRRGGLPEQVRAMTAEEIQARCRSFYKPNNAILVLAGAVDSVLARQRIDDHFGKLPPGEKIPEAAQPGKSEFNRFHAVRVQSPFAGAKSRVCLGYLPPQPDSELYAPFLLLISQLWSAGAGLQSGDSAGPQVFFTPLDDGGVVAVSAELNAGENTDQAIERLEAFVAKATAPKLRPDELTLARQQLGFLFGIVDIPDNQLALNVYGVAFSLGRREQLGIDPSTLGRGVMPSQTMLSHARRRRFSRQLKGWARLSRSASRPRSSHANEPAHL